MEVSEHKTSIIHSKYGLDRIVRSGRLFKCLSCGLEMHRDFVGVVNMVTLHGEGTVIKEMAHQLLPRWNEMEG